MGLVELLLGVVFVLFEGLGFAMISVAATIEEFWAARIFFIVAGAGLFAAYVIWRKAENRTNSSSVILGVIAISLSFLGTWMEIRWIDKKEQILKAQVSKTPESPKRESIPRPKDMEKNKPSTDSQGNLTFFVEKHSIIDAALASTLTQKGFVGSYRKPRFIVSTNPGQQNISSTMGVYVIRQSFDILFKDSQLHSETMGQISCKGIGADTPQAQSKLQEHCQKEAVDELSRILQFRSTH